MLFRRSYSAKVSTTSQQVQEAMQAVSSLVETGDESQAREKVKEMVRQFPLDYWAHLFASSFWVRSGDMLEAIAENAISMALEPTNPIAYKRLGQIMRRMGHEQIAEKVLETGWRYYKQTCRVGENPDERKRFFLGSADEQSLQPRDDT